MFGGGGATAGGFSRSGVGGILRGMPSSFRDVDPREFGCRPPRPVADPVKLARQIARFGASMAGMPAIVAYEGTDGVLLIYNGVTRATRMAKLAPGTLVRVEVIGSLLRAYGPDPKIGDSLP